jgi:hypothetical protein
MLNKGADITIRFHFSNPKLEKKRTYIGHRCRDNTSFSTSCNFRAINPEIECEAFSPVGRYVEAA